MRKFVIVIVAFVLFCFALYNFVISNLEYHYFEFTNNTEREINLNVEHYYIKSSSFSKKIPPFAEIKFKIDSDLIYIKLVDLDYEINIEYYLIGGGSFFFKTKYKLEYDGEKINTIYADKIDYWF